MKFIKNLTWEEVFENWRKREADNSGWINCATKIKGWPDWESWRRFSASQIKADQRDWQMYEFIDPATEIPEMLVGPYSGWQSKLTQKNTASFFDSLDSPKQYEHVSKHEGILAIMAGLPFSTEFIGLLRKDNHKIVCLDGHHRATAIALAKKLGKKIDFHGLKVSIALAQLPAKDIYLLDEMLQRGSSKDPQN